MIDGLRAYCEVELCKLINKDTACFLFQLADSHRSLYIKEEAFDFLVVHFDMMSPTQEYQDLPDELKKELSEYMERRKQKKLLKTSMN